METGSPIGGLWGLATIIGPIIFIAVLAWVIISNRKASARNKQISEQSAVDLREELTAERKAREAKGDTSRS